MLIGYVKYSSILYFLLSLVSCYGMDTQIDTDLTLRVKSWKERLSALNPSETYHKIQTTDNKILLMPDSVLKQFDVIKCALDFEKNGTSAVISNQIIQVQCYSKVIQLIEKYLKQDVFPKDMDQLTPRTLGALLKTCNYLQLNQDKFAHLASLYLKKVPQEQQKKALRNVALHSMWNIADSTKDDNFVQKYLAWDDKSEGYRINLQNKELFEMHGLRFLMQACNDHHSLVTEISFAHNNLEQCDSLLFKLFPKLKKLDLSHNKFTCIKKGTFVNVLDDCVLDLSNNALSCIEKGAFKNSFLGTIDLSNNALSSEEIKKLKNYIKTPLYKRVNNKIIQNYQQKRWIGYFLTSLLPVIVCLVVVPCSMMAYMRTWDGMMENNKHLIQGSIRKANELLEQMLHDKVSFSDIERAVYTPEYLIGIRRLNIGYCAAVALPVLGVILATSYCDFKLTYANPYQAANIITDHQIEK